MKKLITFHLFKNMMTHLDLYKESIYLILYQLTLFRIHFIYFWSVQLILFIFISKRSEWLYFIIFKSSRRLNMILHRDFMIPIMNFHRIRDLLRALRSIPVLSGNNISHDTTFRHISYFRHTISYFRLGKVVILITSTIRISLYEEWWKLSISYFIHLRYDSFLKIFVISEEEYLSVFISLINAL